MVSLLYERLASGRQATLDEYYDYYMYLELANFESSNQIAERVDPYFPYCHRSWQYSLPLAYKNYIKYAVIM